MHCRSWLVAAALIVALVSNVVLVAAEVVL